MSNLIYRYILNIDVHNGGSGGRHDFVQNPTIDLKNVAFCVSFHKLLAKIVEAKCWGIVSKKTLECTNSEAFRNISSKTLNTLLKRNTLTIAEVDLFKAVLRWTNSECARQGINIKEDKIARRRVLGDSLYEIRFLAMSEQDFATYATSSGLLTYVEIVAIFQKFNGLHMPNLKWKNHGKRQLPRLQALVGISRFALASIVVKGALRCKIHDCQQSCRLSRGSLVWSGWR